MKRLVLLSGVLAVVACSGAPGSPRLAVDAVALAFGEVPLGQSSTTRTLFVDNLGTAVTGPLVVTPSAEFRVSSDGCSGATLEPSARCAVELVFEPAQAGARTGVLRVEATPGGAVLVDLLGTGVESVRYGLSVVISAGLGVVTGDGIDCGADCAEAYPAGTTVVLTAVPDPGWIVAHFANCDAWVETSCTLTMTGPRAVSVRFEPRPSTFPLTIDFQGTGSGRVVGGAVNCTSDCTVDVPADQSLSLTAIPASGSTLGGFSGCDVAYDTSCDLRTDRARTVVVTFSSSGTATLTIQKLGSGAGVVTGPGFDCGSDCVESFPVGTLVAVIATAAPGSTFGGFSGCDSTTATGCQVRLTGDRTVVATFTSASTSTLTVRRNGTGQGTVTGPGISCGTDCSEVVSTGTVVTLTAAAAAGSAFGGWSGCDTVTSTTCTLAVTADRTVDALFSVSPGNVTLTVVRGGSGTGNVTGPGIDCGLDCTEALPAGTIVILTATPAPGSTLASIWGCDSVVGQVCTKVLGNLASTVTANFVNGVPPAPTGLAAQAISPSSIRLAWTDASPNETNFEVARSGRSTGPFVTVASPPAETTTWTDTGLSPATTSYYRVRAVNAVGASGWSNTASATTPAGTTCTAGASRCVAGAIGSVETCNASGTAWTTAPCPFGQLCTRDACHVACGLTATPALPTVCFVPNHDGVNDGVAALWTDNRLATTYVTAGATSIAPTAASISLDASQAWPWEWSNLSSTGSAYVVFRLSQFGSTPRTTILHWRGRRANVVTQYSNYFSFGAFNASGTKIAESVALTVPSLWGNFSMTVAPPYANAYTYTGGWNTNHLSINPGWGSVADILEVNWLMLQVQ